MRRSTRWPSGGRVTSRRSLSSTTSPSLDSPEDQLPDRGRIRSSRGEPARVRCSNRGGMWCCDANTDLDRSGAPAGRGVQGSVGSPRACRASARPRRLPAVSNRAGCSTGCPGAGPSSMRIGRPRHEVVPRAGPASADVIGPIRARRPGADCDGAGTSAWWIAIDIVVRLSDEAADTPSRRPRRVMPDALRRTALGRRFEDRRRCRVAARIPTVVRNVPCLTAARPAASS